MGFKLSVLSRENSMFSLSYKDLRSDDFRRAVSKLGLCEGFTIKAGFHIGRLVKEIDSRLQASQVEWVALADPLIAREENGNFKLDAATGFAFKEGVDKEAAREAIDAFVEKTVEFSFRKFTWGDLSPVKLTPIELVALAPMLIQDAP